MEKRTSSGKPVIVPQSPPHIIVSNLQLNIYNGLPRRTRFGLSRPKSILFSLCISLITLCRTYNDTLPLCQGRFKALNTRGAGSLFKLLQWTESSTKRSITSKPSFILIEIVIVLAILTMISSMAISVYVTNVPDVTGENTKSLGDFI